MVLPDAVQGGINYTVGEKLKICLTFDNAQSGIGQVMDFVNQSLVVGWQVSFIGTAYSNATIICSTEDMFCEAFVYGMMNNIKFTQVQ